MLLIEIILTIAIVVLLEAAYIHLTTKPGEVKESRVRLWTNTWFIVSYTCTHKHAGDWDIGIIEIK